MRETTPFAAAASFLLTVGFFAFLCSSLFGCEHGSLIPIDPVDVCEYEGVEECCICDEPTFPPPRVIVIETTGWTCEDFADRVPGHRPKECR